MIAAVIGEELGCSGSAASSCLYGLFGYAGLRIAQRARDRYGKLLAAGLTSLVLVQAVINLFAVLGLAPLTGVPLPFVSYGNSSMLVMLAAVGLLLNIAREAARVGRRAVEPRWNTARRRRRRDRCRAAPRGASAVPRVVIAAGGTAGHVVPALAVADALRAAAPRSRSSARASAPRPSSCPPRATRSTCCDLRGLDRCQPRPRRRRRCASPPRPSRPRAGCCASAAPRRCWAAAATSPGPPGSRRSRSACRWS